MKFPFVDLRSVILAITLAFTATFASAAVAEAPNENFSGVRPAAVTDANAHKWLLDYHGNLAKHLNKRAYSHLEDSDREKITKSQVRIKALLAGVKAIAELNEEERVELWNAHAQVEAVLESREDLRLVCERVNKTGTHVSTMECLTVATRTRMRQDAEALLRDTKTFVDTPRGN